MPARMERVRDAGAGHAARIAFPGSSDFSGVAERPSATRGRESFATEAIPMLVGLQQEVQDLGETEMRGLDIGHLPTRE